MGDRLTFFLLGCAAGYILCHIVWHLRNINKDLDVLVEDHEHKKDEGGMISGSLVGRIMQGAILVLLALSLFVAAKNNNDIQDNYAADEKSRCEGAVDSRAAQRDTVDFIYNLAASFLERGTDEPPLTQEEVVRANLYIDKINDFRVNAYDKIKPSETCAPYVDDDNVEPPTPPYPHFEYEGA